MTGTADLAELLQHSTWMRRLALSLVRDPAAADDLVQETWLLALRHPPRAGQTARPWLGEVLRNVLRARFRSDSRRARREDASAGESAHAPSAEQLVGDLELQRLLAEEVMALDEPYRSTLLLRFYEGLSAAEIAARGELPAGTVRWRLKEGLDQLRARLDRRHAGDRGAWLRALAPLTGGLGNPAPAVKGALAMKIGLAVVLATAAGVAGWSLQPKPKPATPPAQVAPKSPSKESARMDPPARADRLRRIEAARRAARPAAAADTPTLDKEYIRDQIKELIPLIKECFENALEHEPDLSGKVVVGFSIVGDPSVGGLVGESQVIDEKSTIANKDLRECIQESMYAAQFPPPKEGGEVRVEYPFVLMPAPDGGQ